MNTYLHINIYLNININKYKLHILARVKDTCVICLMYTTA